MLRSLPTRRQAYAACFAAVLTALGCAGLLGGAVVGHAPVAVLPLLIAVCIGCPMAAAWSLPVSIAVLRATAPASDEGEGHPPALDVRALRRHLDRLPETEHPLGL